MKFKKISWFSAGLTVVIIFTGWLAGFNFAFAAWNEPGSPPPAGNVPAPLNQGTPFLGDAFGIWNGTGVALKIKACLADQVLKYDGTNWICAAFSSSPNLLSVLNAGADASTYGGNVVIGTDVSGRQANFYVGGGEIRSKWIHADAASGYSTISKLSVGGGDPGGSYTLSTGAMKAGGSAFGGYFYNSSGSGVAYISYGGVGVAGYAPTTGGVMGIDTASTAQGYLGYFNNGVWGYAADGNGVYGQSGSGWAGYFLGGLGVGIVGSGVNDGGEQKLLEIRSNSNITGSATTLRLRNETTPGLVNRGAGEISVKRGAGSVSDMTLRVSGTSDNLIDVMRLGIDSGSKAVVSIGTNSPATGLMFNVAGNVGAAKYCNQDGTGCKTLAELGGAGQNLLGILNTGADASTYNGATKGMVKIGDAGTDFYVGRGLYASGEMKSGWIHATQPGNNNIAGNLVVNGFVGFGISNSGPYRVLVDVHNSNDYGIQAISKGIAIGGVNSVSGAKGNIAASDMGIYGYGGGSNTAWSGYFEGGKGAYIDKLCLGSTTNCKNDWAQVSTQWSNNGSDIYYNNGKVGIGTNTPETSLDVKGQTPADIIQLYSGGSTHWHFGVGNANGDVFSIYDEGNSANPNFVINKINGYNGFVGIGDSTPDHKLDVGGGNIGLDSSSYINFGDTDGSGGYGLRDSGGAIQYKNSAGSWTNIASVPGGSNKQIQYNNSGVFAGANALTYDAGNSRLGIGNPSPAKALDIGGVGGIQISRSENQSGNNELYFFDNGQIRSSDNNHRIIFNRTANQMELREYGDIIFSAGSGNTGAGQTAKMVVSASGNTGIGIPAPGQKLEVNGGIKLNTATVRPSCDATTRGTTWFTQGAAGEKDTFAVCAKNQGGVYAWRALY